ncbi:MAG: acetylxylan esterase [Bacteroidetes bacterium GWF2_42_66]|nr:MAG: acetylxylan esterase [Bacteroidetes bacterium GWA2_42_15]OFX96358.1 MAG: acetylxylan esterase [Bacteroidetes bacterium GWE2_42_39]OFY46397.1 MAG: acetylxylan esterase [Bacteroidetes bacterium GWF2_42_66]HAZ03739.1 acetylxylan esterase [Marinilabiliales bacterium]HBL78217.1 acetylxylan esterase [Prolixibacteraceae bacterium]
MKILKLVTIMLICAVQSFAQESAPNFDETLVPFYTLPDPLTCMDGSKVTTTEKWTNVRRAEILKLFSDNVYGVTPDGILPEVSYEVISEDRVALNGKAIRKEVLVKFDKRYPEFNMSILIYLPVCHKGSVPVFLAVNTLGNQEVSDDQGIIVTKKWVRNSEKYKITNNSATEASRGARSYRWPIESIIERGYGIATFYCGDIDRDDKDDYSQGIQKLFAREGQTKADANEWAAIGAWAWGLSRCLDYFETDSEIDPARVVVLGHSRTGKAALWAGAQDTRFAVVISNDSGCGGAAISRRCFGETVNLINSKFPHWFCGNFKKFNNKEDQLPVDQHMLIALIAPRPVYVASAEDDRWSDPKGEFLSAKHAGPVYSLFGLKGVGVQDMPKVSQPVFNQIGYHIRKGGHDILPYDWEYFMDFTDYHFYGKNSSISQKVGL